MKKRFLFIALLVSLIFLSASSIYATDSDAQNNLSDVSIESANLNVDTLDIDCASSDSNVYSNSNINNVDSDNSGLNTVNEEPQIGSDSNKSIEQVSSKNSTNVDVSDRELYYKNGTSVEATLVDGNGNPIANQNVTFNIIGKDYTMVSNEKGVVSLPINLNPGVYTTTVSFAGNDIYQSSQTTVKITVLSTILSYGDIVKFYKNDTQFCAQFLDNQGNPLAGATITYNIIGKFYQAVTDSQGIARLDIRLNPGTYIITAIQPNNGLMYSNNIKVLSTINGSDLVKVYQDNNQYYATFLDYDGSPLANTQVTFNIMGKIYTPTTDSNGVAKVDIDRNVGEYVITGIHPQSGLMYSNTIKVLPYSDTLIKVENITVDAGERKNITATLYNQLGYTIPNQTMTITIGNTKYQVTTDSNGIATVPINLSSGLYTVTYSFDKTSTYGASTASSTINVANGTDVIYDVNNTIIYWGNKESFNVLVKDINGNIVTDGEVIFRIIGKEYLVYTDEYGIASLPINLIPGIYDISYTLNKLGYNRVVGEGSITVVSTNQTTIIGKDTDIKYGAGESFNVTLMVGDIPLANQNVTFYIIGKEYQMTTDSNGVAYLPINLIPGTYSIEYKYHGSSRLMASSGSATIEVFQPLSTTLTYTSVTDYVEGSSTPFTVVLKDSNGNVLANQAITITVNGKNYIVTTDGDGVASVTFDLAIGTYTVKYVYDGTARYLKSEGSVSINVISGTTNGIGYWVQGKDMKNVNLATLASQGVGNIFLNFYAFTLYGEPTVLQWISQANSYNIKVHIWMQSFYDGGWISPVLSDGTPNYSLFNKKIAEAVYYATLPGVSGIHLDYLRFPGTAYKYTGGTAAINEFVKLVSNAVRGNNSNIILSAAVMPEKSSNTYYYGQDITVLGKYLDVIVPMVYKGNYNAGTSWISSTTKWFVENSQGAQIWVGLQTYKSDSDTSLLSKTELASDAQAVINAGATGVVMFRFGLSNLIDFNTLVYPSGGSDISGVSVSMSAIYNAAANMKKYIETNGVLPSSVSVDGYEFNTAQFLYLMSKYIANFGSGGNIEAISVSSPTNPSGDVVYGSIYKTEYSSLAKDIISYINTYEKAPEYMNSSLGKIEFDNLVYSFSKVINYMGSNSAAPAFVYVANYLNNSTLTVNMYPSNSNKYEYKLYTTTWLNYCPHCGYYGSLLINPKGTVEGELTCDYCDADYCGVSGNEKVTNPTYILTKVTDSQPSAGGEVNYNISLKSILTAATELKAYIEANDNLPDSILIDNGYYTLPQFLYLMAAAIKNIYNSNFDNIELINVSAPTGPSGSIISDKLYKDDYYDVASRLVDFVIANGLAPNYSTSDLGNIIYDELLDAFSRILTYYNNNGALPNYVQITYGSSTQSISALAASLTSGLTTEYAKAEALFNWVRDEISYQFYYNTQKGADLTLSTRSGNCCDQAQLLVAMARSVGLTIRFATGTCKFTSGNTYGHVWTQFYLNGKWVIADTTSSRNSLGSVKNWNTNSYTSKGTYTVLPY